MTVRNGWNRLAWFMQVVGSQSVAAKIRASECPRSANE